MKPPGRVLALTVLAAAMLALLGSPAPAAPGTTVEANLFLRDLTLPAGGPGLDEDLSFFLSSGRAGWADEVTLTVDISAATGVADVVVTEAYPEVTCLTTGQVVRCTVPGPHQIIVLPESGSFSLFTVPSVLLSITPKAAAAAGDAGALTITARADDGPTTTRTSRLRIGEGVNLTAIDPPSRSVAPGGSAALRPQVRNSGTRDVRGLTLVVAGDGALAGTDFGNCAYDEDGVACTFDTTVAAGRTYRTSAPFTVQAPRDAVVGSAAGVNVEWLTDAEWQDWHHGRPDGRPGTGPDLELEELASAAAERVPQADVDGDDNGTFSTVTVTGRRRTDVVAVGVAVTGSPGEAHTIDVGLVNRGPGTLHYPPFGNNLPVVYVNLPPGLSVVRADERCSARFEEEPGGVPTSDASAAVTDAGPPEYSCGLESVRLRPGQRLSFTFAVRAARDGEGWIDVLLPDDGRSVDRNAGNNRARITVSVDGEGGGLPVTGNTAGIVAGGGVLLMLLGAAVLMKLRSRTYA